MDQQLNQNAQSDPGQGQRYREKLLANLAKHPDFAWVAESVMAAGSGGTIEITVAKNGRLKALGVRLRRECQD